MDDCRLASWGLGGYGLFTFDFSKAFGVSPGLKKPYGDALRLHCALHVLVPDEN